MAIIVKEISNSYYLEYAIGLLRFVTILFKHVHG